MVDASHLHWQLKIYMEKETSVELLAVFVLTGDEIVYLAYCWEYYGMEQIQETTGIAKFGCYFLRNF